MERSEAITLYEQSEGHIKMLLREITDDNCNSLLFHGKASLTLFDMAKNISKIKDYILDDGKDTERLKKELLNLRKITKELQDKAFEKGYEPFAHHCDMIIRGIDTMEKWETDEPIQETNETKSETGDKSNGHVINRDEIIRSVERITPFTPSAEPKKQPKYKVYYERLIKAGVIDDAYDLNLFQYCVERADISKLIVKTKKRDSKKGFARLFLNDVASVYQDSSKYREQAKTALGIKSHIGAVGGDIKKEYQALMKDVFEKDNWQRK